ncbi:hypothetical protein [Pseudoxanthomonas japonensis]|uniref:hypothetical protein n=1 Tax=Pseudoxanthomonas japonensis TaxID=69284 RepID=UPI001BCD9990|nr:hypothetical protein [Pseudoxanthomonas japonensis]
MNAQLRPATLTESELRATIYFAVGVASEGSLRGRNVAYDLAFAGYIHQAGDTARGEPREAGVFREGQLEPIYNSGYSIGTLQTDFGQQRNDVNRNADRLLDAYQAWAQEHTRQRPDLALTPAEYDMASDALRRQGNEIRGDRQVVTDNGYDVPAGIKTRLSEFLGSDDGITFVHNQDVRQVNHLLRNGGSIRQLEDTLLYQNATADDQIRMATVISKLENQDGRRNWPRIVERIESGAIDSVDDLKAAVPRHLHGDRDNALRGAELVISLRGSEPNNPLHAAWQSVVADPLVNPTQLDQDRTRPNLLAEYSTVKNLFLVPAQGRAFVEALDVGGTRTQDVRFQGAPAGHTAGLYASGSDLVQWNRNGHGHAYVGGEWREIERSQVTRTDRDNGVVELNVARDGVPVPLLHIDPRAPRMQPRPDLPQDVQRQPGRDGSSIHNRGPEQGQQADGRQGMLYDPPGRWEESLADRYLAAVMSGDSALADRAAVDFARSAEGRHMEAQGERLLAQQQAAEQSQAHDRQMTR